MSRPAISNSLSRYVTLTGWIADCATCVRVPMTWTDITSVLQDTAPASKSNPVRKNGTRAPSSYSRSVFYANTALGSVFNTPKSPGSTRLYIEGPVVGRGAVFGYLPDQREAVRMLNDCRMKALASMSESHMQFNAAAAQAKSTITGIRQFAQKGVVGLRNMYRGLSDPFVKRYKNVAPYQWRDIPGDYLGWLYGLKPIGDDISNGLEQLSGMSKQDMAYGYTVRRRLKRTSPFETQLETLGNGVRIPVKGTGDRTSIASVGYKYEFPKWWIQNVPVVTPFSEAWELTRLSFVLDWVLPVGNWIGSMESAQFDPYFVEGFETWSTDEVTTAVQAGVADWILSCPQFRQRKYRMERLSFIQEGGTRPSGRVVFPEFRNYLGINHAAQGLSLLTQMLTTPPSKW